MGTFRVLVVTLVFCDLSGVSSIPVLVDREGGEMENEDERERVSHVFQSLNLE